MYEPWSKVGDSYRMLTFIPTGRRWDVEWRRAEGGYLAGWYLFGTWFEDGHLLSENLTPVSWPLMMAFHVICSKIEKEDGRLPWAA